jgi:hypothetical protein
MVSYRQKHAETEAGAKDVEDGSSHVDRLGQISRAKHGPHYMTRGNRRARRFPRANPDDKPDKSKPIHGPCEIVLSYDINTFLISDPDGKVLEPTLMEPDAYEDPTMVAYTASTFLVTELPKVTPMVSLALPDMKRRTAPFGLSMFSSTGGTFSPRDAHISASTGMQGGEGIVCFGLHGVLSGSGVAVTQSVDGVVPIWVLKEKWKEICRRDLVTGEAIPLNEGEGTAIGNGRLDEESWETESEEGGKMTNDSTKGSKRFAGSKTTKGHARSGKMGYEETADHEPGHHSHDHAHQHSNHTHAHLHYLPWREWSAHAYLTSTSSYSPTRVAGTRTFLFNMKEGLQGPNGHIAGSHGEGRILIRDYNPNVQGFEGARLKKPLGSILQLDEPTVPVLEGSPDDSSSATMTLRPCTLDVPQPTDELHGTTERKEILSPRFDDTFNIFQPPKITAARKDRKGKAEEGQTEQPPKAVIENGLPLVEYGRDYAWSDDCKIRSFHFDGKHIVVSKVSSFEGWYEDVY